jgi:integrase
MASIRKRAAKDGGGYQVRYYGPDGRSRATTFAKKGEAVDFANSVQTDLTRGDWIDPAASATPLNDYIARYMDTMLHWRPSTRLKVQGHLRNYIEPAFGTRSIGEITPPDVRRWVGALNTHGLSAGTVHAVYTTFQRVLKHAVIDNLISRSPCIGISLPPNHQREEMRFLAPDEIARLGAEVPVRLRALIYTAAYTGMRWGELAGLKLASLDLLKGTVDVHESIVEVNGTLHPGSTKTGARRTISLPKFLRQMLDEHIETFPPVDGLVFTSTEGGPLRRNFYRRHFKPAVVRAGLDPRLRFHDLRHTCAALLIAQGAHPKEIQERLGHSTIRMTFDRYGHLFPTLDDRLRDGLDRLFEEGLNASR